MTRRFVMLSTFEKQWEKIGLNDNDLSRLQQQILQDPKAGDVIQGTGGLRKIRFAFENRGKSGSARVVYVDFAVDKEIFLFGAYAKNEKTNLTKAECNEIKKLIENLKKTLRGE